MAHKPNFCHRFHEGYDPDGCSELDLSKNGGSKIDLTVSIRETWEAMEELVAYESCTSYEFVSCAYLVSTAPGS